MKKDKAKCYTKAFSFGKREHRLERWTNMSLFVTLILFSIAFYLHSWYLMHFVLAWLIISISVHLTARLCHCFEKKWHKIAHAWLGEEQRWKLLSIFVAPLKLELFNPYLKLIIQNSGKWTWTIELQVMDLTGFPTSPPR